ncbi:hypothetical protein AAC387_Pa02g0695 [Persea americana]
MSRKPGDWNCRSCQHLNFSRRDSCQRCGEQRSGDRGDFGSFGGRGGGGSSYGFTAQAASSAAPSRMSLAAALMVTANVPEVPLASPAPGAAALPGNLVIGIAPGLGAMSTTLRAGWNASDAMHLGTLITDLHIQNRLSFLGTTV